MIPLSINEIHKNLLERKFKAEIQSSTQQIYIVFNHAGREFPLFIKVDETNGVLQLLIFLPCTMRPNAPQEVARLLHLLNKEMDLPGFGMDEQANVIFYRLVMLTHDKQIQGDLLNNIITSMVRISGALLPTISSVAGGTYFEAISMEARKTLQKFSNK